MTVPQWHSGTPQPLGRYIFTSSPIPALPPREKISKRSTKRRRLKREGRICTKINIIFRKSHQTFLPARPSSEPSTRTKATFNFDLTVVCIFFFPFPISGSLHPEFGQTNRQSLSPLTFGVDNPIPSSAIHLPPFSPPLSSLVESFTSWKHSPGGHAFRQAAPRNGFTCCFPTPCSYRQPATTTTTVHTPLYLHM